MLAARTKADPRPSLSVVPAPGDVRPVVALPRRGIPAWMLIAAAVIAGLLLFAALESRRQRAAAPSTGPRQVDALATPAPPPPLYLPPEAQPDLRQVALQPAAAVAPLPTPRQIVVPAPVQPRIVYVPQPAPPSQEFPVEPPAPPPRVSPEPALVMDGGAPRGMSAQPAEGQASGPAPARPASAALSGSRTRAGVLANRSTTVPQGTLIPAVLETALDSNRPGLARALVSRDVRGFDGSRILIPRGSRLIGEYASDSSTGQRRAVVNWLRLIRPDGATIAIGSPAGDPLGRGGISARVSGNFFERFGSAVLQSVLNIGAGFLGSRSPNVVILQGGLAGATQVVQPQQVTRTLTVRQGTSISIFVARDLDFTGVEGRI